MASKQLKGTVEGFTLWAFERFRAEMEWKEASALKWVLDKWVELDAERLRTLGIDLPAFRKEHGVAEVFSLEAASRKRVARTPSPS